MANRQFLSTSSALRNFHLNSFYRRRLRKMLIIADNSSFYSLHPNELFINQVINGILFNTIENKLWSPFKQVWNFVFWPQKLLNFIQSEAILRSPSVARRNKAKRGIKFKSEWGKKNDFHLRQIGSHSEMPILFNMELYSIATTLWDSLNEVLHLSFS